MYLIKMQKALHLKDALKKKDPKIKGDYIITEKLDGWYGYLDYDPETGWEAIRSSSGRVIPSLAWLSKKLRTTLLQSKFKHRLIFEIIIPETPFHILNGILNRKYDQAASAIIICHDLINLNRTEMAYQRLEALNHAFKNIGNLEIAKTLRISSDRAKWELDFKVIIDAGGEGIVMKQADGLFMPGKRNSELLKWKEEVTLDLEVIKAYETIGKKGEPALSLKLRRVSGVEIAVVVPKDIDRIAWTENPSLVVGKVAEIKAMKELPNGKLREPRFKCLREDKLISELSD